MVVDLDGDLRRLDGGSVLVGGSPLRLLRLRPGGVVAVDRLQAGEPLPADPAVASLVRRLLDAGMAHPRRPHGQWTPADVTVVVPVHDHAAALARLLAELAAVATVAGVVVVDDGSRDPARLRQVCAATAVGCPVEVVRSDRQRGPAAARNLGAEMARTPAIAFLDADSRPQPGWLDALLGHFADPAVGAVAPRVEAALAPPPAEPAPSTSGWSATVLAYERARSPLDLGPRPAPVRPRSRVPYVPTACLLVRRAAFETIGGFDESLRVGEDVDFVWRLGNAGWTVRYEPDAHVHHEVRPTAAGWLRQRFTYGTSAAPLSLRHGRAVAPLAVSGWSALAWGLVLARRPLVGGAVAGTTTALLAPRLRGLRHPWRESLRLAGRGHLAAGRLAADALRRAWWPLALALALGCRRTRPATVAAATLGPLAAWVSARPPLDPVRWVVMVLADDAAYGAGVWVGCARHRTIRPLLPDLSNWPGRRPAVEPAAGATTG